MNFLSLITREEPVVGLEISDAALRIVSLLPPTEKGGSSKFALATEQLQPGIIVEGKIADKNACVAALERIMKQPAAISRFAIVTIPNEVTHTETLSFPGVIPDDQADGAIKLALNFHIPWNEEDTYFDSARIVQESETPSTEVNTEFLLIAAQKSLIDEYLNVLQSANIHVVAIEPHLVSTLRIIEPHTEATMTALHGQSSDTFTVIEGVSPRFLRSLPHARFTTKEMLDGELTRMNNYYETEHGKLPVFVESGQLALLPYYQKLVPKSLEGTSVYFAVIGAAGRGLLARREDHMVSLLPLSTETLYEFQKAVTFSDFLKTTTIAAAAFFTFAYFAIWGLMISIQEDYSRAAINISSHNVPADLIIEESRAHDFNAFILTIGDVVSPMITWSTVVQTLYARTPDGISIIGLTLGTPTTPITLTGVARSRPELNAYKKTLEQLPLFSEITLPLANLDKRADIPFTITFSIKDPTQIAFHL